jgi:peptide-methionine (S)-S-oxide reductase
MKPTPTAAMLCFALVSTTMALSRPQLPNPVLDPKTSGEQTAVLAGGCFWGVEAVYEALAGVKDVVSGYAGGSKTSANYRVVSSAPPDTQSRCGSPTTPSRFRTVSS